VPLLQQGPVEHLDDVFRAVVHQALRVAFVILVGVVFLFTEARRVFVRGREQRIVGVLLEVDAIGVDRNRALRDDDVAPYGSLLLQQVALERLVGGKIDFLVAIGFLGQRDA